VMNPTEATAPSSASTGVPTSPSTPGRGPGIFLMCDSLHTGGIERQFNMLARALREHGYEVHLGCMRREGTFLEGLGNIEEFPTGGGFFRWKALESRWRIARFLRKHKVQVAQSFDFYSNLMMVSVAKLARVPVVIACQNQIGDLLTSTQNRAEITNFRLCARVVCNSRAAAERLRRFGLPATKLVVIPNGISEAPTVAEPAFERQPGRVYVALIARMNSDVKNHDVFLRAAAKVLVHRADTEFLLVGDGPLRHSLELLARELRIASRVKFLGDRRDVPAVLAAVDISVVPSRTESLANVVLESMAAGKPVVASNVGGLPEVVHHAKTGLLVRAGDENELASAIELLISRPDLREEYGRAGQQFVRTNFSAARLRDEHLRLYDELLSRH
jgi:L-malate glycosyltransferase